MNQNLLLYKKKLLMCFFFLSTTTIFNASAQDNIVFPAKANSRITDVVAEYGADNTGVNDATQAIQDALNEHSGIIYLPNGTYKVSKQLRWGAGEKRTTLQGQSKAGTIIKLASASADFLNASSPRGVIWTGESPAQRFSNEIRNLTVNIGTGNPGASGIQFIANNAGGIDNVLIKSDDSNGVYGLDLGYTDEQGPCLIKRLEVQGFKRGIRTKYAVDGVVMSQITLKNQTEYGIYNEGQCLSIENLTTTGSVPALYNISPGVVAIINSTFTGSGNASTIAAITNQNGIFARNITTTGFLKAIDNQVGGNTSSSANLTEFVSHPVIGAFTSAQTSLNLTVKQTPEPTPDALADWVNVGDYPAETITLPNGRVVTDFTNSFQKAIDAGKGTVYFGDNSGPFYGTVTVRGNVKLIRGLRAWMGDANADASGNHGTIIVGSGTPSTVVIDGFGNSYNQFDIVHNARTLAVKNMNVRNLTVNSGAGELYIEDMIVDGATNIAAGKTVYARQYNMESLDQPRVTNNGNLWILGIKTERDATAIRTNTSAKTEVIGGFIYANKSTNAEKILFSNGEGSQFSATFGEWVIRDQPFKNLVQSTRDGVTRLFTKDKAYGRGQGSMVPLYVDKRLTASAVPNAAPTGLAGTAPRYDQVVLTWSAATSNEDGFLIERRVGSDPTYVLYDMAYANQTSFTDNGLIPSTTYTYRIRAVNSLGKSAYSNVVSVTTKAAPAKPATPTNMTASLADNNIRVTWTDVATTETGYKLERKAGAETDFTEIAVLPAGTTSYYQVGLPGSTTYQYRVRAYLEITNSDYSGVATATTPAPTELVVHWKFEELSGTTAGDASGHARNGSLRNGLVFGTNSVTGKVGKALQLDGTDDLVRGDDDGRYISAENYPFSMSAWVKTTDDGVVLHLGDKDRLDMFYTISVNTTGEARLTSAYQSTTGTGVNGKQIKDGAWHLVTGVFESSTTHRLYVDGALSATLTGSFPFHKYMTRFCAGAKEAQGSASGRLAGTIDDVRLYSRVLTAAEISALYGGSVPPTSYTVDNTDPGFSTTGTWTVSTSSSQRYGINYLHDGDAIESPGDGAKWMSPITTTGRYDVYMIWAAQTDRPVDAPVEINYDGGVFNRVVNQRLNGGTWYKLGTWQFTSGSGDYVSISGSASGNTIADAVRWVPEGGAVGGLSVDQTTEGLSLADLKEESVTSNGLLVYPNPTAGSVNLSFTAEQSGQANIEFYNAMGQKVLSTSRTVASGANNLRVDLNSIAINGVYYVKVTSGSKTMNQTVLINK